MFEKPKSGDTVLESDAENDVSESDATDDSSNATTLQPSFSSSSSSPDSRISSGSANQARLSTLSERASESSKQRGTYLTANPVAFQLAEKALADKAESESLSPNGKKKHKSVSFSQCDGDRERPPDDLNAPEDDSSKDRFSAVARESFALGMDPEDFLELPKEGAVNENGIETIGGQFYSYRELVRKNYNKDYDGINSQELENYLTDKEFEIKFGVSKEAFAAQPKWRRIAQKKALLLF